MIYTPKIQQAILLAIETHETNQKQKRKGKDIPYIAHPFTAGLILARAGAPEDVIIAGILHDTIEDSIETNRVTFDMLTEQFGENVANLVLSVTEQNKTLTWAERKAEAIHHIESFSNDSVLVKSADLISNVSEIIDDYNKDGEAIFNRFGASRAESTGAYINAMSAILARWPESPLSGDIKILLEKFRTI